MEKQTAVEYLFEKLWETPKDKLTWHTILKKAKEMEETQHNETAEDWWKEGAHYIETHGGTNYESFHEYYKKKFENE
jgi:hypothetical protein